VLVFVTAKVVFMLSCQEGHALTADDMGQVIANGLTLDLSTSLYFLALPFILTIISLWHTGRWIGTVLRVYFAIIALAFALAFVSDTSLYPFWNFKLDASCLQYLETPTEAMASVSTGYILVRLVLLVILAILVFLGYTRPKIHFQPTRNRIAGSLAGLFCIPLIVIGIRGGLDESTTNVGQVYFSQDQFLNHSAVNPVFSFVASLEKSGNENASYNFYSPEEMAQLTEGLYDSGTQAGDTLLTTQRPNVVVILLESCGKMFLNVMPNLCQAADEGVDFTNCFGNSYRTDRGTVSSLSGYLSFPTMSVMKMSTKVGHISSIARTLRKEGYDTEYLYGGDINFTKMKGYLISTGFERLHWKQDYSAEEQATSKWGVCDEITFNTLGEMILRHNDGKPFLIGYSTLSSHEPWDVPVKKYKEKQYNGFCYVDQCIGTFLDKMRKSAQWDNLLIVFMPDHSSDFNEYDEQHPDRNRIPMIWTGGAVKEPRKLEMLCNQSDFAATLLGQMGLRHDDFTFSRDVTSSSYRYPFAIHMFNNGLSMTDSTGFMLYDLTSERIVVKTSPDAERMANTAKAILQMAGENLKKLDEVK
jgi:phosphoglycerol transferase MdoB-like AlkP superfamily enzyme